MAWLQQENSGIYHVCFRFGSRRLKKSTRTREFAKADRQRAQIEETIELIERGRLIVPDGADLLTFLTTDGRLASPPRPARQLVLGELFDAYVAELPRNSHAPESLRIAKIHVGHICRLLGGQTAVTAIDANLLQRYVSLRSRESGKRGAPVSSATVRKEIATFRTLWRWARGAGLVSAQFPNHGLKYPLDAEAPPFLTWAEIERRIERGISPDDETILWGCLYLSTQEVDSLLQLVKERATYSFLYPMCLMAAHTGARRSELCRSRQEDIDFAARTLVVREKKRVRGKLSYRQIPLSPRLEQELLAWCRNIGDSIYTFPADHRVARVRNSTRRECLLSVSPDEATDHLATTLKGTPWENIKGWHVFRHSFISNCACQGVDQRMIDAWVGHQTDAMRQRYRHLFPNSQRREIEKVFH